MGRPEIITRSRRAPMGINHQFSPQTKDASTFLQEMKDVEMVRTADGLMFETRKAFSTVLRKGCTGFNGADWGTIHTIDEWIEIDSTTGRKTSHPLVFSKGLFRVRKRELEITAGGSDVYVSVYSLGMDIGTTEGGTDILNYPYLSSETVGDVIDAIDATALTALVDGEATHEAYVVGNQSNVNNITVDDGAAGAQTLAIGDIVDIGGNDYLITDASSSSISIEVFGGVTVTDNTQIELSLRGLPAFSFKVGSYFIAAGDTVPIYFYDLLPVYYPVVDLNTWPASGHVQAPFTETESGVLIPEDERGMDVWRHVSVENYGGCAYIAAGQEAAFQDAASRSMHGLFKYDGQNVYRAGLPRAIINGLVAAGSGTGVDAGTRYYALSIEFVDAQGNILESDLYTGLEDDDAAKWAITLASAEDINLTVFVGAMQINSGATTSTVAPPGSYMANFGIVVGNQVGVTTIQVDDGVGTAHSIHVGDTVYFYDGVAGDYTTRTVTAAQYDGGSGQITISGAAVNVSDNEAISVNVRVKVWRTIPGGADYYLVEKIVPDFTTGQFTYTDSTADASLGEKYVRPEANELHLALDIVPSYVRLHEGSLIATGDFSNPNTVFPSIPGLPEYFPATLQSEVGENANDIITGLGKSGEFLVIGKQNSLYLLSGPILDAFNLLPAFRITLIGDGIGCSSHRSMVSSGEILYVLSQESIHLVVNGQLGPRNELGEPLGIGLPVSALFGTGYDINGERLLRNRATAVQHKNERFILFNIPVEKSLVQDSGDGSEENLVLIYFLEYGRWGTFDGNRFQAGFNCGAFWSNDGLWLGNLHQGPAASNDFMNYIALRNETGVSALDYKGNVIDSGGASWSENSPNFSLKTAFEFANGESPTINMLPKRLRVFSGLVDVTPSFDYTVDVITNFQGDGGGFTGSITQRKENLHRFKPLKCQALSLHFEAAGGSADNYKVQISGWDLEIAVRDRERLRLEARGNR